MRRGHPPRFPPLSFFFSPANAQPPLTFAQFLLLFARSTPSFTYFLQTIKSSHGCAMIVSRVCAYCVTLVSISCHGRAKIVARLCDVLSAPCNCVIVPHCSPCVPHKRNEGRPNCCSSGPRRHIRWQPAFTSGAWQPSGQQPQPCAWPSRLWQQPFGWLSLS